MAINFPSSPILDQIFTSDNTSFIWNGTAWVGYSTSFVVNYNASSIVIKDDNSIVGATTSINFGDNLSVSAISAGIVTVTGSASGSSSQFVTTAAGIHTLSNVGIGTTNPTEELHIYGTAPDIQIESTSSTNASQLLFKNNVGNFSFIGKVGSAYNNISYPTFSPNSLSIYNIDNSNLIFGTNNLERFRVSGGGNVGIGTTNPTSKLTVSGDALINGLTVGRGGNAEITNTAIGFSALQSNTTTGYYNTGIGWNSLVNNTIGSGNVAMGILSLYNNIAGNDNTATGSQSLQFNTTGSNNTAMGSLSLWKATGSSNVAVGAGAGLSITTGSKNTILGSYTGNQNGLDIRTSSNNVVLSDGDGNIRFYANSSGNVGLGTTNPTSALTVVGASGTTLLVTGGTIPIQIGGNGVSGTIFKVGEINLSGPDVSDVNATYFSNIRYSKVGDFRYNLEFHSGGYTGYGGAAPAGGPGDFIFYKRNDSYGRAERFRISGETGNITAQGGVIAASANVSGISTLGTVQISSGIVTATSGIVTYYGDTSNASDGRWTLGANGAAHYTFTGIGFTQTTNDPVLYLARGRVYEFVNNSGGGHPFEIRTSNNGSAYSDGVTGNGSTTGVIRFEIPFSAPNTLYYQCTNHSGMGSTIIVYPSTI